MALKRKARDIMTSTVITAGEDMLITDVIKLLLRWHISGLPIVDNDGNLVGIITEHDVVNFARRFSFPRSMVSQAPSQ